MLSHADPSTHQTPDNIQESIVIVAFISVLILKGVAESVDTSNFQKFKIRYVP
jgi:hypothetical protein